MKRATLTTLVTLFGITVLASNAHAEKRCEAEARALAAGLKAAFDASGGSSRVTSVRLDSETEVVDYTVTLAVDDWKIRYAIELDNDSASACMPLRVSVLN